MLPVHGPRSLPSLLFPGVAREFLSTDQCVGAFLYFGLHVGGTGSLPWRVLREAFETFLRFIYRCIHGGERLQHYFVEVLDLLLREFRVIAEAVSCLHRIDQRVRWSGHGRRHVERVIGFAQACHCTIEAVELIASGGEAGSAMDFDGHL